jgi:hypothetical protein
VTISVMKGRRVIAQTRRTARRGRNKAVLRVRKSGRFRLRLTIAGDRQSASDNAKLTVASRASKR